MLIWKIYKARPDDVLIIGELSLLMGHRVCNGTRLVSWPGSTNQHRKVEIFADVQGQGEIKSAQVVNKKDYAKSGGPLRVAA